MKQGRKFLVISLGIVFTLSFSLLLILAGFEVYLRITHYLDAQPANYPCIKGDPTLNHVFEPGCQGQALSAALNTDKDASYKVNELGYRGKIPESHKEKLVVIGDSYTEGFGLEEEETFPAQLSAALGGKVSVLNGGTMGLSPAIYPAYFERYFSALGPKLVLLNLDFSDFGDDPYYFQNAEFDTNGHPSSFPTRDIFPSIVSYYIYSNSSAVFRFLHAEINQLYQIYRRNNQKPKLEKYIEAKISGGDWSELSGLELGRCEKTLKLIFNNILRLKEKVQKSGGELAIHVYLPGFVVKEIPFRTQNISFVQKFDQLTRKDYTWSCDASEAIIPAIQKIAQKENISLFSTADFIRRHPKNKDFYFQRDAHWNPYGIKLIIDELLRIGLRQKIEGVLKRAPR